MKKAFTLMAIAALITTASFAQHNRDIDYSRDRDIASNSNRGYGYGRDRNTYHFTAREKNMQVMSINREYNRRIESVKDRLFMGRAKKQHIIYSLELQREAEVRAVIAKFNDRRNMYDRRNDRDGRYDRRNNW